eukprot:3084444-Prorocentrum_lima.AAC.1
MATSICPSWHAEYREGAPHMLLPWVAPIKAKSDAPKDILRTIRILPTFGPLRGDLWSTDSQ